MCRVVAGTEERIALDTSMRELHAILHFTAKSEVRWNDALIA
ncbi:hypothetical protein SBBP2_700025 [Burkholderiales bacterium]|nr:hypothetical protein SBBP2_700025 [Burkholderiales bacterium]